MSDDESSKMLDMIREGSFCDLSYALLLVDSGWSKESIGNENIASYFAKKEKSLQEKIDKFVDEAKV